MSDGFHRELEERTLPTTNETPTPRTDAAEFTINPPYYNPDNVAPIKVVVSKISRQLEGELAEECKLTTAQTKLALDYKIELDELRASEAERRQAMAEWHEEKKRALEAEAACAEMRGLLIELRENASKIGHHGTAQWINDALKNITPGQGWHSPEEWNAAEDNYAEVWAERNGLQIVVAAKDARIVELEQQVVALRKLFPKILLALESGGCTEDASLEFLQHIPEEVRLVIFGLKQQLAESRKDSERLDWLVELSKTQEGVEILGPFDGDDIWTVGTMEHSYKGFKTLREAIDNAKGDK